MVGDGDAVGIAGQVVENMFGAAEGWLGVDHPVLLAEFPEEAAESARQGKLLQRAMQLEPVVLEEFTKPCPELAAEASAKCLDGKEEARRGIDPSGAVGSEAAGGNDVVDMGMMLEVLSPGMEHAEESDVGSQVLSDRDPVRASSRHWSGRADRKAAACSGGQERRASAAE